MSYVLYEGNDNVQDGRSTALHKLTVPAPTTTKAAGQGFIFGVWVDPPRRSSGRGNAATFLGKYGAYSGGGDGYVRFTTGAGTLVDVRVKNSANTTIGEWDDAAVPASCIPTASNQSPKPFLFAIVQTATNIYLTMTPVGEAPTVYAQTTPNTIGYTAVTQTLFDAIGSGSSQYSYPAAVGVESLFMIQGTFPEVGGTLDTTLLRNLADGTQPLDTLHTLLGGTVDRKFHFGLENPGDRTDAWGTTLALTEVGITADRFAIPGRNLRPRASCKPARMAHVVGELQADPVANPTFNPTLATTRLPLEAVTLSGTTGVARAQYRLLKEDGATAHVGWTNHPGTLASGVHPLADIVVAGTPGFLFTQFREVNSSGAQVGPIVPGSGLKGTGIGVMSGFRSQSQGEVAVWSQPLGMANGAEAGVTTTALTAGCRFIVHYAKEGAPVDSGPFEGVKEYVFTGAEVASNRGVAFGMRQFAIEINALFPGYPVMGSFCGKSGTNNTSQAPGGNQAYLSEELRTYRGYPHKDAREFFYGHSSPPPAAQEGLTGRLNTLVSTINQDQLALGWERKPIVVPLSGTQGGFDKDGWWWNRQAYLQHAYDNPTKVFMGGFFGYIGDDVDLKHTGGHSHGSLAGAGRMGTMLAYSFMSASGWLQGDGPRTITKATAFAEGGAWKVKLTLGLINAPAYGVIVTPTPITSSAAVLSAPTGKALSETTANGTVSIDRAGGTLYSRRRLATDALSTDVQLRAAVSQAVTVSGVQTITTRTGLTSGTTHVFDYMHQTTDGLASNIVSSPSFTLSAAAANVVDFTVAPITSGVTATPVTGGWLIAGNASTGARSASWVVPTEAMRTGTYVLEVTVETNDITDVLYFRGGTSSALTATRGPNRTLTSKITAANSPVAIVESAIPSNADMTHIGFYWAATAGHVSRTVTVTGLKLTPTPV